MFVVFFLSSYIVNTGNATDNNHDLILCNVFALTDSVIVDSVIVVVLGSGILLSFFCCSLVL
jgi:hypothetical protein